MGSLFDWYYGITNNPTLTTNASSSTATISSGINLRLNALPGHGFKPFRRDWNNSARFRSLYDGVRQRMFAAAL